MQDWENLKADKVMLLDRNFTKGRQGYEPEYGVIHHNGGDLTIEQCYATWQSRAASAHWQTESSGRIGQFVLLEDTAHHAANWLANCKSVGFEHANNRFAPYWTISQKCLDNGARLFAMHARHYDWGIPQWERNMYPHCYFAATACPGALNNMQRAEYISRAKFWYDTKELTMTLDDIVQTLVPGSKFKDKLGNFIRHADRNSYEAATASKQALAKLSSIQAQNDEILELLKGRN